MTAVDEVSHIGAGVAVWTQYDPSVKAELWSTAIRTRSALLYIVDPIPLAPAALAALVSGASVGGIVVSNENHFREAASFSERLAAPVIVHAELAQTDQCPVQDGEMLTDGLRVIHIPGAPRGEFALHLADGAGTVVVGDALINFEPHGFAFLPDKYCVDPRLMRRSLRKRLALDFDRMVFAHGTPVMSGARAKLQRLLSEE